jgi:pimeloyl-ACP methyl ester carboxylesterase
MTSRRVRAADGVELHVEVDGDGPPILFLHEVAGTLRSWDPQVQHLHERFRCVRYNARGYPPSDVPRDPVAYSQSTAVDDALAVLDGLGIDSAHLVGFSMGGFATMHLILRAPSRVRSAMVVGAGYGSNPAQRHTFQAESVSAAEAFRADPEAAARAYAAGPTRMQLRATSPERWAGFRDALAGHDPIGQSLTFSEVLGRRPSLLSMVDDLVDVRVPVHFVVGDEDDGCLETNLELKRAMPSSALTVLPRTGHTPNLEDPAGFANLVASFVDQVQGGGWSMRSPESVGRGLVGM